MANRTNEQKFYHVRYVGEYKKNIDNLYPQIVLSNEKFSGLVEKLHSSSNANKCIFVGRAMANRVYWINDVCVSTKVGGTFETYMDKTIWVPNIREVTAVAKDVRSLEVFAENYNLPFEEKKVHTHPGGFL